MYNPPIRCLCQCLPPPRSYITPLVFLFSHCLNCLLHFYIHDTTVHLIAKNSKSLISFFSPHFLSIFGHCFALRSKYASSKQKFGNFRGMKYMQESWICKVHPNKQKQTNRDSLSTCTSQKCMYFLDFCQLKIWLHEKIQGVAQW